MHALDYFFAIDIFEKRHDGVPGVVVNDYQDVLLVGRGAQDVDGDFLPASRWKRRSSDGMAAAMLRGHGLTI